MKAVIIYESTYGNTHHLDEEERARAWGAELGRTASVMGGSR